MASPRKYPVIQYNPGEPSRSAELISLLEIITETGSVTDEGAKSLEVWVSANADPAVPAIEFLELALDVAHKETLINTKLINDAIEKVLPSKEMQKLRVRRMAFKIAERERIKERKIDQKLRITEAKRKNQPVYQNTFNVTGVSYDNRAEVIRQYLQSGH